MKKKLVAFGIAIGLALNAHANIVCPGLDYVEMQDMTRQELSEVAARYAHRARAHIKEGWHLECYEQVTRIKRVIGRKLEAINPNLAIARQHRSEIVEKYGNEEMEGIVDSHRFRHPKVQAAHDKWLEEMVKARVMERNQSQAAQHQQKK